MDDPEGNGHCRNNNINNFAPLYESDDEEGTKHRTKPKTLIMLLSEKDEGRKNKGGQNKSNEDIRNDQEKKKTAKVYDLNND